ncbi:hypothetical protein EXIGLDRAFT_764421 [Exidia glandulosa HHB12029]|uniref:LysM domain-containing protein n=1 Tax=Exidia glandulosa HHB12029 TaxID=1314781 RepID=A0A165L7H6_EXIGL|nr:hypothetical protein EXIGLDRAFT_764421 [Exidia glandulosa HHB12029]
MKFFAVIALTIASVAARPAAPACGAWAVAISPLCKVDATEAGITIDEFHALNADRDLENGAVVGESYCVAAA